MYKLYSLLLKFYKCIYINNLKEYIPIFLLQIHYKQNIYFGYKLYQKLILVNILLRASLVA